MKVKRKPSDGRIMVSKNYHLKQFCGAIAPNPFQVQKIFKLALRLEEVAKARGCIPAIVACEGDFDTVIYTLANAGDSHRIEL